MEKVGSSILKNSLNMYLARVAAGARILITDRGRPIAKLVPVADDGRLPDVDELVAELLAKGAARCENRQAAGALEAPGFQLEIGAPSASDLLIEDRRQ